MKLTTKLTLHGMALALLVAGGHNLFAEEIKVGGVVYDFDFLSSMEYYLSGKVRSGDLAREQAVSIGGVSYTFDNRIYFYESGKVKAGLLADDKTVSVSIGGETYTFFGFFWTSIYSGRSNYTFFYESGKVKMGYLNSKKTVSIGGVPYTLGNGSSVFFYESGKVMKGGLESNMTVSIGGVAYTFRGGIDRQNKVYRKISFYESGKVKEGILDSEKTVTIRGVAYKLSGNAYIQFYESGRVKWGYLVTTRPVTIAGINYTLRSIGFHESRKIKGGAIVPKQVLVGKDRPFIRSVNYSETGKIIQIRLKESAIIQGKAYGADTAIRFYTDGTIADSSDDWDNEWTGEKPKPKKPQ